MRKFLTGRRTKILGVSVAGDKNQVNFRLALPYDANKCNKTTGFVSFFADFFFIIMGSSNALPLRTALAAVFSTCCITYTVAQYDVTFSEVLSGVPTSTEARYRCSFANTWTSRSHPIDYPETTATWESPALAAHTSRFKLWREGEMATKGVETFAKV